MCFPPRLPPALAEFLQGGAGSSQYEHALLWSLVALVCILAIIVLM